MKNQNISEKHKKKNKKQFNEVYSFADFTKKPIRVFYSENSKFFIQNEIKEQGEKSPFYKKTPARLISEKTNAQNLVIPNFSLKTSKSQTGDATIFNFRKEQSLFYEKTNDQNQKKSNIVIFGSLRDAINKNSKK